MIVDNGERFHNKVTELAANFMDPMVEYLTKNMKGDDKDFQCLCDVLGALAQTAATLIVLRVNPEDHRQALRFMHEALQSFMDNAIEAKNSDVLQSN